MPSLPVNELPNLNNAELAKGVNGTMCGSSEHIVSLFEPHAMMALRRLVESHRAYELLETVTHLCSLAAAEDPAAWKTGEGDGACDDGTKAAIRILQDAEGVIRDYKSRGEPRPEFVPIEDMPTMEKVGEDYRRKTLSFNLKLAPVKPEAKLDTKAMEHLSRVLQHHGFNITDAKLEPPK